MATLRSKTNPRALDVSPQLQNTLNANGMQAHIAMTPTGEYQLVTMSHNSSQPRYYALNQAQMEALMNGGTNVWDKKAYNTFVSIVKNDYYIPGSWVAARNANSPVNMGLNGHRINPGEYGYMGRPHFRPFEGARFGRFNSFLDGFSAFGNHGYHVRRIDGRPFLANSAPVVIDRPDGRLKPGELKSGSYGFYDKGTQPQADVLSSMKITEQQPKKLERPKGQATPLSSISSPLYLSAEQFQSILASHGVIIDEKNKLLTIQSSSVNKDFQYKLKDEEVKKLMSEQFKFSDKNGVSVEERLGLINSIIGKDFVDKITKEQLNTKDYVNIKLSHEVEKELHINQQQAASYAQRLDVIDMKSLRQDYKTGYVDKWNSIGVVDGRSLDADKGFYLPVKDGRAVSVGEIQAYPTNDGQKTTFRMTAVINNQIMSHEISKDDYLKFINYDDEYRLKLFDKIFDEVQIKSASNGQMQDAVRSGNIDNANGVVTMKGDYSLVNGNVSSAITGVMAWKDQISGNYQMNVRTDRDAGIWSFKITEAQYLAFKNASDEGRAKMITSLIPFTDENKEKLEVVESKNLHQEMRMPFSNGNVVLSEKVISDLRKEGLGVEAVQPKGAGLDMPKGDTIQTHKEEVVHYGKETINLNDLRNAAKINLLGDAGVNGESLENTKASKEWKRSGEHGRSTEVGDISVERLKDAEGKVIEGKYKMSAVIDGNVFSHEITQKQYDKFIAVNDYQRMKLFDKIFPEVEMKTKPGHGFNLGAAILAAVTTGLDVAAYGMAMAAPPRSKPDFYESKDVYFKPGVVSAHEVAAASYESLTENEGRGQSEGRGMGM